MILPAMKFDVFRRSTSFRTIVDRSPLLVRRNKCTLLFSEVHRPSKNPS